MVIRNNTNGQRSYRNYSFVSAKIGKTLEKLSSGYRINRAGDDAAGLAISEKMRAQVTGLERAKKNSQEGIGLIQTGEGAMQEVHDMLDRALYLAGESANGTYMDALDRENLQKELDQLTSEIDRITTSANFNNIKLFQNLGAAYERSTTGPDPAAVRFQKELEKLLAEQLNSAKAQQQSSASTTQSQSSVTSRADDGSMTLEELAGNTDPDKVNIVYIEHDSVSTTQTPEGGATGSATVKEGGQDRSLNEILEKEIVPNIINQLLQNYSAFSYLKGSNIGIGLEYFHGNGTSEASTLAYVRVQASYSSSSGFSLAYTLGVNLDQIDPNTWDQAGRESLESTIAHEMIHAFMDEATTAGMLGWKADAAGTGSGGQDTSVKFPMWFIEGMAQTASGPGNWIKSFGLTKDSTDAQIKSAISSNKLSNSASSTASQYGTGYLACMYLGWLVAFNGQPPSDIDTINASITAGTISYGLNKLLGEIIGGSSMNAAISKLTGGKFASMSAFQTAFDNGNADYLCNFTRGLLGATGSGRGGLISGDLTHTDLASNNPLGDDVIGGLFKLNPDNQSVKNLYPKDYPVLSGGTLSTDGVAPTGFEGITYDFGDFIVIGAGKDDVKFEDGTLTISGSSDVTIRMKDGVTGSTHSIVLNGTGKVTLNGVETSGSITINEDVNITLNGANQVGGVSVANGKNVTLTGSGSLKTDTFTSDNTNDITINGVTLVTGGNLTAKDLAVTNGAVIAGGGTGAINCDDFKVSGSAVVVGNLTSQTTSGACEKADVPVSDIPSGIGRLTSITIDGTTYDVSNAADAKNNAQLWLDTNAKHRVTFSDGNASKTMIASPVHGTDGTFEKFVWETPPRPYMVTAAGGAAAVEGVDFAYDADGLTLIILKAGEFTISTDQTVDETGNPLIGRIKVKDGIAGTVDLTLNNVSSVVTEGCAFDLGTGNTVTLRLENNTENTFISGSGYAGVHIGNGTALTIEGGDDEATAGKLIATGGKDGAGIGSNGTGDNVPPADAGDWGEGWENWATSSITINGGNITATGTGTSGSGAGIGAGTNSSFGVITITGGIINAHGGTGGAGIGGAGDDSSRFGTVGTITITGGTITAISDAHGAGIGGGWGRGADRYLCHDIIIKGDAHIIEASSGTHGTGIGVGCLSMGGSITITDDAVVDKAVGGSNGAGIGASNSGKGGDITISGNATIKEAIGGDSSAGIGAGSGSTAGKITIDTTGTVSATGGQNGVGIGSGYNNSSVGDITISQGTVNATGGTDGTGIGAGRRSTSGNIYIGNSTGGQVIVNAMGGMKNNGANIQSYTDSGHTNAGKIYIFGDNTSVRAGPNGEGTYNTSGVIGGVITDDEGNEIGTVNLYSWALHLYELLEEQSELDLCDKLHEYDDLKDGYEGSWGHLPLLTADEDGNYYFIDENGNKLTISSIKAKGADDGSIINWSPDIAHTTMDGDTDSYVYLWMTGQDQDVTITFSDGTDMNLHLKFYEDAGKFRLEEIQDPPEVDEPPDYNVPEYTPSNPSKPDPDDPTPPAGSEPDITELIPPPGEGGIILQIGANYGEILEVPRFYVSAHALGMDGISIATQEKALNAIGVLRDAVNRVSGIRGEYGALQNRLEHNINDLSQAAENVSNAESRIRDADMAEEYTKLVKLNIVQQAAQAMLAHSNEESNRVLQLLQ